MIYSLGNMLGWFALFSYAAMWVVRIRHKDDRWIVWELLADILITAALLFQMISEMLAHDWTWSITGVFLALMVWTIWHDWRKWKNRKKIAKAVGAKAKAARDKLVKRVRELGPSPVRVPS